MDITIQRILDELHSQDKKKIDLTNYLGLVSSAFGNWQSGRNQSYKKYLHAIADFLGVSVEYLRGETDQKKKPSANNDEGQQNSFVRSLSQHEQLVILAYRIAKPEAREIIDNILRIQPEEAASPSRTGTA